LRGADLSKPETRAGLTQFGKTGLAYGKALTEQETAGLQAKKTKLEINEKTLKAHRERMSDLALNPSPENTAAHIQDAIIRGDITPEQGDRTLKQTLAMSPEQRKQYFLQLGADAAKRLEQMSLSEYQRANLNKPVFSAEAGGFVIPPRVGGGGGSVSAGGGMGGGAGAGGAPAAGVIPVEGLKTKTTEAEKQAAYNTKRILTAAKDISKAVENNPSAIAPGFFEAIAPGEGASNLARSADRQLVSSGYADLIDAALYLATGAAYNKEQLEAQKKALLPAFTDTEENRQSKQLKIIELINAAKIRAGKEWTPDLDKAVSNLFPSLREAPPINVPGVGSQVNTPGGNAAPAAANTVTLPNGAVKIFPSPEAAAQFKKAARL
jgi:hypothetical protein